MQTIIANLASLALLGSVLPQVLAVNTWEVAFWQGIQCTGEGTGERTGPNKPKSGSVCGNIPDVGYTSTGDFLIGQGQGYSYYLQLFPDENCKGGRLGQYDGNPGGRICFETNSAKSYQIVTKKGTKMARSEINDTEEEMAFDPAPTHDITGLEIYIPPSDRSITSSDLDLAKRAKYSLGLIQFGVSSTAAWIYMAAGRCPATATEGNINNTQCALAATFAVLSAFFSVWQAQGLYRHGAPDARRRDLTLESIDELLNLPKMNTALLPGLAVSMHSMEPFFDDAGDAWHQYSWSAIEMETNIPLNAVIRLHPDGRSHAMSSAPEPDHSNTDGHMRKRANTNAYYSWVGSNHANFNAANHDKSTVKRVAASVWNYGKSKNVAEHCVDFTDYGQNPTKYIDYGSYAVVKGTYTDQSGLCEQ